MNGMALIRTLTSLQKQTTLLKAERTLQQYKGPGFPTGCEAMIVGGSCKYVPVLSLERSTAFERAESTNNGVTDRECQ
jgi:hypothetical protein